MPEGDVLYASLHLHNNKPPVPSLPPPNTPPIPLRTAHNTDKSIWSARRAQDNKKTTFNRGAWSTGTRTHYEPPPSPCRPPEDDDTMGSLPEPRNRPSPASPSNPNPVAHSGPGARPILTRPNSTQAHSNFNQANSYPTQAHSNSTQAHPNKKDWLGLVRSNKWSVGLVAFIITALLVDVISWAVVLHQRSVAEGQCLAENSRSHKYGASSNTVPKKLTTKPSRVIARPPSPVITRPPPATKPATPPHPTTPLSTSIPMKPPPTTPAPTLPPRTQRPVCGGIRHPIQHTVGSMETGKTSGGCTTYEKELKINLPFDQLGMQDSWRVCGVSITIPIENMYSDELEDKHDKLLTVSTSGYPGRKNMCHQKAPKKNEVDYDYDYDKITLEFECGQDNLASSVNVETRQNSDYDDSDYNQMDDRGLDKDYQSFPESPKSTEEPEPAVPLTICNLLVQGERSSFPGV